MACVWFDTHHGRLVEGTHQGGGFWGHCGGRCGHPGPCCASREASDTILSSGTPPGACCFCSWTLLLHDPFCRLGRKPSCLLLAHCVQGKRDGSTRDEAFAWESREFLRKKLIGQVMGRDQQLPSNRQLCHILTLGALCFPAALRVQGGLCGGGGWQQGVWLSVPAAGWSAGECGPVSCAERLGKGAGASSASPVIPWCSVVGAYQYYITVMHHPGHLNPAVAQWLTQSAHPGMLGSVLSCQQPWMCPICVDR